MNNSGLRTQVCIRHLHEVPPRVVVKSRGHVPDLDRFPDFASSSIRLSSQDTDAGECWCTKCKSPIMAGMVVFTKCCSTDGVSGISCMLCCSCCYTPAGFTHIRFFALTFSIVDCVFVCAVSGSRQTGHAGALRPSPPPRLRWIGHLSTLRVVQS